MLSFETIMKWPGAALILHISTDYDGNSNPTQQGTWTDITALATWDVDNTTWGSWTPSGDVDLTNYISSTTYIAYEYLGSCWDLCTIFFSIFQLLVKYENQIRFFHELELKPEPLRMG